MSWTNRITSHENVDPRELTAHPLNWRDHPLAQQQALDATVGAIGWVKEVIVSKRSGRILDGHLRVERATANDEATIPVAYVDLSENEENLILATIDPLAELAGTDREQLTDLLYSIDGEREGFNDMLTALVAEHGLNPQAGPIDTEQGDTSPGDEKDDSTVICPRCGHEWLPE